MLFDNSNKEKSVATWLLEQTKTGKLDVTSGYFTVGILSFISRNLNEKIENYRFVLGDILANDQDKENPINLLTEPTLAVCLDADRLDIGCVGITPDPRQLPPFNRNIDHQRLPFR